MIPKLLRFKAFESYIDEQLVDFEKLSQNGIFLINGDTGSGKSAILDAMTYALYGETSGGMRNEVRCLFEEANEIPTEVEFTFEVGGKTYRFIRSIKARRQRNGNFQLLYEHNAMFLDKDEFVPFDANPTKTSVNAKARELLGLSPEQFRQVVILPQGKFEEFLVSDSSKKEEILSTLFKTDKYTKISENLISLSDQKAEHVKSAKEQLDSLLSGNGCKSFNELLARIDELSEKIDESSLALKAAKEDYTAYLNELTKAKSLAESFEKLSVEMDRLNKLSADTERIENLKIRCERAKAANRLTESFNVFNSASEEFVKRKSAHEALESELFSARKQLAEAEKSLGLLSCRQDEHEKIREKAIKLKQLFPAYEQADKSLAELKVAEKELEAAKTLKEKSEAAFSELSSKYEDNTTKITEIKLKYSEKIPELKSRTDVLKAAAEKNLKLIKYTDALNGIIAKAMDLKLKRDKSYSLYEKSRNEYEKALSSELIRYKSSLAKELRSGTPCPVCGSLHHPSPAEFDGPDYHADIEKLQSIADSARIEYDNVNEEFLKENSRIEPGKQTIRDLTQELSDCGFSVEEYKNISEALKKAVLENSKISQLEAEISRLKEDIQRSAESKALAEKEVIKQTNIYSEKQSRLIFFSEQMIPEIKDLEALKTKINFLEKTYSDFQKELSEKNEYCKNISNKASGISSQYAQAEKEKVDSERKLEGSRNEFSFQLKNGGFTGCDEWKTYLLSEDETDAFQKEIENYNINLFSCKEQCACLQKILIAKKKPDISEMENILALKEHEKNLTSQQYAVLKNDKSRLQDVKNSYTQQNSGIDEDIREAEELRAFAELFRGSHGESFTRYILGVMLSMVTFEANRLLTDNYKGKFQLFRKTDEYDRRRQSGLELEVLSSMSAKKYGVKNLSGGEKFMISLSLSMALSTILQSQNGGIAIDAMFIDEGFGSLHKHLLSDALNILFSVSGSRRTVGIISHVDELKELLPSQLNVTKNSTGSHIKMIL